MTEPSASQKKPRSSVFDVTSSSPRWSLLRTDEKTIAAQTTTEQPVMFLTWSLQVVSECLCDLRRARTQEQLKLLLGRLCLVIREYLGDLEVDTFQNHYLIRTRARLILLGADRATAKKLSERATRTILDLRNGGIQPPLRYPFCVLTASAERQTAERLWDANGQWLDTASGLQGSMIEYGFAEMRALGHARYECPLTAARGPRYQWPRNNSIETASVFNTDSIDKASRHVCTLLEYAVSLIRNTEESASTSPNSDAGMQVARVWDGFGEELDRRGCFCPLQDRFIQVGKEVCKIADVARPSIHEAVWCLSRRVWSDFRSAMGKIAPAKSLETERWQDGPWQGHEVLQAFERFREQASNLISVLQPVYVEELKSRLRIEAVELKNSAALEPNIPKIPPPPVHVPPGVSGSKESQSVIPKLAKSASPPDPVPKREDTEERLDGPFATGCFRLGNDTKSGIGRKQWKLLRTLWDLERGCPKSEPQPILDVWRSINGRTPLIRDTLKKLKNDLNDTLSKQSIGYEADFTAKGADYILLTATKHIREEIES